MLSGSIHLLNVYLPYQCHDNYDIYVEYIGKLSAIIEDCSTSKIAIIGDFNADVGTAFETELLSFCADRELIISDHDFFGRCSDKYTYVSDAHSTTSWLDHFICSYDLHTKILEMQILEKSPSSDHLSIYAKFLFDIGLSNHNEGNVSASNDSIPFVKYQWAKASDIDIEGYRQ